MGRAVTVYVPGSRVLRPTRPVKGTRFVPRCARTVKRPTTSHDGAGPRTRKTTRVGAFTRRMIWTACRLPTRLTRRGEAFSRVTRACSELDSPEGRLGRCGEEYEDDLPSVLGEAAGGEPCGGLEGAAPGGATTFGGATGRAGAEGTGGVGAGARGGGGGTGAGGGGGAGGIGTVTVGTLTVGSVTVGSVTVGSPTWPSACVLRNAAAIPATSSAARLRPRFSTSSADSPCRENGERL